MKSNKFFLIYLAIIALMVLGITVCNGQTNSALDNLTIRQSMTFKGKKLTDVDITVPSYLNDRLLSSGAAKSFMLDWFVVNDSVFRVTGDGTQFRFVLPSGVSYLHQLGDVSIPDTSALADGMQLFFNGTTRKWNASYWNGIVDISDLANGIRYKDYTSLVITDSTLPPAAWVLAQIAAATPIPYVAGNGIKFGDNIIRWADSLFSNTTINTLSNSFSLIGNGTKLIESGTSFATSKSTLSLSNTVGSFQTAGTDLTINGAFVTGAGSVTIRARNGTAAIPARQLLINVNPDSIKLRSETASGFVGYQMRANTNIGTKYLMLGIDSTSGGVIALRNVGREYLAGTNIRMSGDTISFADTLVENTITTVKERWDIAAYSATTPQVSNINIQNYEAGINVTNPSDNSNSYLGVFNSANKTAYLGINIDTREATFRATNNIGDSSYADIHADSIGLFDSRQTEVTPVVYKPETATLEGYDAVVMNKVSGRLVKAPTALFAGTSGSTTLAGLTDVNPTGWTDGKQLFYNGTTSKWEAGYWNGMLDIASATNGLRYTNPGSFVPTDSSLGTIGYNNTLYAPLSRNLTAGYGLVGGGTLAADRSFRVDSVDIPTKLFLSDRLAEVALQFTHAAGAVPFGTGTGLTSDAANLFWNNSTKRLGIGNASPSYQLDITGTGRATTALHAPTITADTWGYSPYGNSKSIQLQGSANGVLSIFTFNTYTGTANSAIVNIGHNGFAPTSGSGVFNGISLAPVINQTGTANGQVRGIYVAPTLTSVAGSYRGLDLDVPGTNHYGIYQTGANSRNYFQGRIGVNNATPDASAVLDVQSTDKGILIPRMNTAQIAAIASPALGLYVFNTDSSRFGVKVGSGWKYLAFHDDVASSSSAPAGANMQVQYNDLGTAAGATNVKIEDNVLRLDEVASTPTPSAGGMKLYSKDVTGMPMMYIKDADGNETPLQTSLMFGKMPVWVSFASGTTAPIAFGAIVATAATMGTANPATTNNWTKYQRKTYTTSTTAGNASGIRQAYTQFAPAVGGYFAHFKFGQTLTVSGEQKFVGMCQSTAALGGNASALVNMIGVGVDAADAGGNWFLMTNDGSGTATKIDLGANAARNTTDGYSLNIYAPAAGSIVYIQIVNIATGVEVYNSSITTDIPANTTLLAWKAEVRINTGGTASNLHMAQTFIQPL